MILQMFLSNDFICAVIRMATPIILTAMAANIGRQADVVCQCFEGMMLFAAFGGVIGSAFTNSLFIGILCGIACGMISALFFGYFVIYLDTHPMLMSIAVNTLGVSGTAFASYLITGSKASTSALASSVFPTIKLSIFEGIPVLEGLLANNNVLSYLAFISVPIVSFFIYKTPLGLKIRATGRNKVAAESMGIDTKKTKLVTILIQGFLSSFGGMFMSMAYLPYFTMNMVAGRGFVAIAANNLGAGNPFATLLWSLLFGVSIASGNILQSFNMPSEFSLMIPYVLTLIGLCVGVGSGKTKKNKKRKFVNEK